MEISKYVRINQRNGCILIVNLSDDCNNLDGTWYRNIGKRKVPLNVTELDNLINTTNNLRMVVLTGAEVDPCETSLAAEYVKRQHGVKTAIYTDSKELEGLDLTYVDYYKCGNNRSGVKFFKVTDNGLTEIDSIN